MLLILSQEHKEHLRLLIDLQIDGMFVDEILIYFSLYFCATIVICEH
jgi:hypothetical protein